MNLRLVLAAACSIALCITPAAAQVMATASTTGVTDFNGLGSYAPWAIEGNMAGTYEAPSFPPPEHAKTDFQLIRRANGFFDWASYQYDCTATGMWIWQDPGAPAIQAGLHTIAARPASQARICAAVSIPVVDMAFVQHLQGMGYLTQIVYPVKDNGTSRAYVIWADHPPGPNTIIDGLNGGGIGLNGPAVQGYARLEGAPAWQDQFQSKQYCAQAGILGTCLSWGTWSKGDLAGAFVDGLPSPAREKTLRIALPAALQVGIAPSLGYVSVSTMISDDWLLQPPSPPVPPPPLPDPPVVGGASPNNLAFGSSGSGSASGAGGSGSNAGRGGVPFDFTAFCNLPDPQTGGPRNPAWVASCLANANR